MSKVDKGNVISSESRCELLTVQATDPETFSLDPDGEFVRQATTLKMLTLGKCKIPDDALTAAVEYAELYPAVDDAADTCAYMTMAGICARRKCIFLKKV